MRRGKTALGATVLSGLLVVVAALMLGVLSQATEGPRAAQAAAGEVLVLDVSAFDGGNGNTNLEGWFAAAGKTPVRVSSAVWATMTTADFAAYDAIALPDPTCATSPGSGDDSPIAAAKLNAATWGAAVDGNVIIIGTDEVFHDSQGGDALMDSATDFAVAEAGKTGAYISLACYYHDVASGTPLTWLDDAFGGTFTTTGVGCFNDSHIVATHPALTGLTDAILSNWSCSVHEAFETWPVTFEVLAIAEGIGAFFTAPDGTVGTPYILARGVTVISDIDLSPETDTNPVGASHTVTATVLQDNVPLEGTRVTFTVVAGPNAGETSGPGECSADPDCDTDVNGQTSWTYTGSGGPGIDFIEATFVDAAGRTQRSNRVQKTWEEIPDQPPEAACIETVNPHGKTVPPAGSTTLPGPKGGQNEDGYYQLVARDDLDPDPRVFAVDLGTGTIFGPFPSGTNIKYTEANGATPSQKRIGSTNGQAGAVAWHITGTGDLAVFAVDAAGNTSERFLCLVPPPPK